MMVAAALSLFALLATAPAVVAPAGWEKIIESTGPKEWVSSVLAFGPNDWFAGGVGWLARGTARGIERTPTGPRAVLGMVGEAPDDVFALGDDELIMHFDGKGWVEEHVGLKPKKPGRGADILHAAFHSESKLVAFGPTLLLVRKADRTWEPPPATESKKLLDLADSGPELKLPAKCDAAGWFWLGKSKAMFDCHDGRSFVFDAGKVTFKGLLPRECRRAFNSVTSGQGELFASCGPGKLWKTDGERWRPYASFMGVKELVSISVTEKCVFVASNRVVWRSCGPKTH
jgi:hypothetical protein